MATIIVDANYILRWFLNDIPAQAVTANELFSGSAPETIVVDRVTLAEVTYVLRGKNYDHGQIYALLEELLLYPSIQELGPVEVLALQLYRDTVLDFEDCWLAAAAREQKYKIATFDKKLASAARKS